MEKQGLQKKAKAVLFACVLFNLSIGVLFSWGVIKSKLTAPLETGGWGWKSAEAGLPYTVAIVVFALGLFVGGRIQDKIGPRWVVTAGGALVGVGCIISGLIGNSVTGITISFGVISGLGIGAGYGCVSPPALKWFHPSKKGLVSGLIVGGFGMAAVYFAPLTTILLYNIGIEKTFLTLGVAVLIVSTLVAQFVRNPPTGYVPALPDSAKISETKITSFVDYNWREMIKTKHFYFLFIIFLIASSVGLMCIGNITKIAENQVGIKDSGFLAFIVVFLAITNTAGRIFGGMLSDKIGRVNALFIVLALQALNMLGFVFYQNIPMLLFGVILVGFNYGTIMSVFPSFTADQYGLKNYGANYGVLYIAWGLAGVVAPMMADYFYDLNGSFYTTYWICAVMMALMVFVNFLLKKDLSRLPPSR